MNWHVCGGLPAAVDNRQDLNGRVAVLTLLSPTNHLN